MSRSDEHFEVFFRSHGPALLRTAVLLSAGDRHAGEDLLQDALESCLRHWGSRKIEFPAAYVRTTMARLAQRRRLSGRFLPLTNPEGSRVVDEMVQVDQRDVLLAGLRSLAPRQRVAVVLRYWEGLTEAETAEAMGCSVGTVKSQTHRGLHTLRRAVGPFFPDRARPTWKPVAPVAIGDPR
ncbi:SigE family RNA polymerase sigma factor [Georgenia sp. TF02-10]|uniref:SigE family RNA polymerase sigma factor n=1 Tax=Georgenia sp. TF02-10 TaxID=2917725 RepID=UPI001FA7ED38|nr:SigE family RNA polymerase sigma factor [Georgenia sp. TF02-10]UNX54844.1 SigE family RNA polymerase sigma factor [Georgenia sp. TF02-10]